MGGGRPYDHGVAVRVRRVDEVPHRLGVLFGDVAALHNPWRPGIHHLAAGSVNLPTDRQAWRAEELLDDVVGCSNPIDWGQDNYVVAVRPSQA